MTEERFSIAAAQHEAVVLVVSLGSRTEVKQGTATWKPTDIPDSDSRHAAVRTADGELHTGNWPSYRSVFTPEGLEISRAVVYLNREKTIAALNRLEGVTDDMLVDALFDEVETISSNEGLLDILDGIAEQRPGIATHPRVLDAQKKQAAQDAQNKAAEIRRATELRAKLDAMTKVAIGQSTPEEADAIKLRVLKNVSILPDGTARTIRTRTFGPLPRLQSRHSLEGLEKLAVPIGNDWHMTAQKVVHVNWQESPDEEDVGGLILAM